MLMKKIQLVLLSLPGAFVPCDKKIVELLNIGKDKQALKSLAKRILGTSKKKKKWRGDGKHCWNEGYSMW